MLCSNLIIDDSSCKSDGDRQCDANLDDGKERCKRDCSLDHCLKPSRRCSKRSRHNTLSHKIASATSVSYRSAFTMDPAHEISTMVLRSGTVIDSIFANHIARREQRRSENREERSILTRMEEVFVAHDQTAQEQAARDQMTQNQDARERQEPRRLQPYAARARNATQRVSHRQYALAYAQFTNIFDDISAPFLARVYCAIQLSTLQRSRFRALYYGSRAQTLLSESRSGDDHGATKSKCWAQQVVRY